MENNKKSRKKSLPYRGDAINVTPDGSIDFDAETSQETIRTIGPGISQKRPERIETETGSEEGVGDHREGKDSGETIADYGAGTEYGIDDGSAQGVVTSESNVDLGIDEGEIIEPRGGSKKDPLI